MRIVLVVSKSHLSLVNQMIDQQNVQIVGIVTDDRIFASEHGCPKEMTFAFWQLEEALRKFLPDYILFIGNFCREIRSFKSALISTGYMNRFFDLSNFGNVESFELLAKFHQYRSAQNQYKILMTGISYTKMAIDPSRFELPIFDCSFRSQDLYYDFRITERILENSAPPPRNSRSSENFFRYALIGLAPYSLHYDLSKCYWEGFRMTRYFFALKDLHNSWIYFSTLRSFIRDDFVESIENRSQHMILDQNDDGDIMSFGAALGAHEQIYEWKPKNYPETVAENKKILEQYLQLLEKHEICPIIFLPPMVKEYQDKFCHSKIEELFSFLYDLMKSHQFALVNGWKMSGFDDYDFRDITHMNIRGARKFSTILNNIVMKLEGNI